MAALGRVDPMQDGVAENGVLRLADREGRGVGNAKIERGEVALHCSIISAERSSPMTFAQRLGNFGGRGRCRSPGPRCVRRVAARADRATPRLLYRQTNGGHRRGTGPRFAYGFLVWFRFIPAGTGGTCDGTAIDKKAADRGDTNRGSESRPSIIQPLSLENLRNPFFDAPGPRLFLLGCREMKDIGELSAGREGLEGGFRAGWRSISIEILRGLQILPSSSDSLSGRPVPRRWPHGCRPSKWSSTSRFRHVGEANLAAGLRVLSRFDR